MLVELVAQTLCSKVAIKYGFTNSYYLLIYFYLFIYYYYFLHFSHFLIKSFFELQYYRTVRTTPFTVVV